MGSTTIAGRYYLHWILYPSIGLHRPGLGRDLGPTKPTHELGLAARSPVARKKQPGSAVCVVQEDGSSTAPLVGSVSQLV